MVDLSEDKRTTSGWYFIQYEKGNYIVGYFPSNADMKAIEFVDIKEACAAFIKKEIEDIRNC